MLFLLAINEFLTLSLQLFKSSFLFFIFYRDSLFEVDFLASSELLRILLQQKKFKIVGVFLFLSLIAIAYLKRKPHFFTVDFSEY